MISNYALISVWSYSLVIISYIFLFFKVLGNKQGLVNNKAVVSLLISAILTTVLWGLFELLNSAFKSNVTLLLIAIFDFARYFFWCFFIIIILGIRRKGVKVIYLVLLCSFFIVNVSLLLLSYFDEAYYIGFINYIIEDAVRFLRLSFSIFALVLLEKLFFGITSEDRWKLKPLIIGLSSVLIFDLYVYSEDILFKNIDPDALVVRGIVHAFVVPFLFISLTGRSRNNFNFKLSKEAVFNSFALALSGVYLIIISSLGYYVKFFGGDWGKALQVALVYGSLVIFTVILFSNNLRSILKVYVGKNFFHYIYDYREEWLKFTTVLVDQDSNPEMGKKIIKAFSNILESPSGSLWVKKSKDGAFNQVAQMNQTHTQVLEDSRSSLCQFMCSSGWVIDVEQYRRSPEVYGELKLSIWIDDFPGTWLIIPLLAGKELIGFCTLDKPKNPVSINWEVNDLLKTAGR